MDQAGSGKQARKGAERRGCDRRAFCRTLSSAALTGLPALLANAAGGALFAAPGGAAVKCREKETKMAKKVKEVKARVVSVKGECGLGHKVGDVVTFTDRGVAGPICVHALYCMMPKVFAMMFNAEFPWAQDPDVLTHPCPDAAYPVVFELKRIYED